MSQDPLEKIRALVELASDPRTPEKEREAAAMAAAKRLKEMGVLEKIEEKEKKRRAPREAAQREERYEAWDGGGIKYRHEVIIRDPMLVIADAPEFYRLARLEGRQRWSNQIVQIPKRVVIKAELMTPEEAKRDWQTGSSVIKALTVDGNWFEATRRAGYRF